MPFYAYKITHIATKRSYIGITEASIAFRWKRHIYGHGHIGLAIRKYGRHAFTIEWVASSFSIEDLKDLERILIAQDGTLWPCGFNLTSGGDGSFRPSEATKAKLRAKLLGRKTGPQTPERKALTVAALTGRKHDPERVARVVEALTGRKATAEHRAAMAAAKVGKKLSVERRRNMSAAQSARQRALSYNPAQLAIFD